MNPHRTAPGLFSLLIILVLLVVSTLAVAPVSAVSDIEVANNNNDGAGSLRAAIETISTGGTITFSPSLSGQIITLSSTLNIQKNMVIDASDLDQPVTISGDEKARVFYVNDDVTNAELNHLTISHGKNLEIPYSNSGGGIFNLGHLTLINCTLSDNQTDWDAGAIYNGNTLNVENSYFFRNQSTGFGGAITNHGTMNVTNSIFTDNQSTDHNGGGIGNGWGAIMVISASSIINNSAGNHGGGIYNYGTATITNSTLSGNIAKGVSSFGGGIMNYGGLTISNSTLSGNIAEGVSSFGGGIMNYGVLTITNSTIFGNSVRPGGIGGIYNGEDLTYINTIVAGSDGGDCNNNGTIHSDSTHNLVMDGSCHITSNLSGDPMLLPLADNGGPTLTHALLPGSPAIDTGSDAECPNDDQRGISRPQDGNADGVSICDIGAFEVEHRVVTNNFNDGDESLRHTITDISPGSIITFLPGLSGQTITLSSSLVIEKHLMIDGSSLSVPITLSGNNAVGVLMIGPLGEVTLDSIKIIHGNRENGGGILNMGVLTIMNGTIAGNHALGGGGGIFISGNGDLTIRNSTLSNNTTEGDGGAIFNMGFLEAVNSTLSGNNASFKGGGIFNSGTLMVEQSIFSTNVAMLGGGIRNDEGVTSKITVTESTFSGNIADHGGALDNWGDGPNQVNTSDLNLNSGTASGGAIRNWSVLTVENSTLSDNSTDWGGGGINNEGTLTLLNVALNGNKAAAGGGIYTNNTLIMTDSTLSGNSAYDGGGIYNLYNLMINNCTLFENTASYDGGGILNVSTLNITNSTLSGNIAKRGGGILNDGSLNLLHVTLFENIAEQGNGGGIINFSDKTMKFINTIVAHSTSGDCVNLGTIHTDSTHNLVTDGSCGAWLDDGPMLGPLADNGGPTWTHGFLSIESPAIDAGAMAYCPNADQRGVSRPQGTACDIGAFEFDPTRDGVIKIFLPLILR